MGLLAKRNSGFRKDPTGLASFSAQVPYSADSSETWENLWGGTPASTANAGDSPEQGDGSAAKRTIFFSRDYRYLQKPSALSVVLSIVLISAVFLVYILFYEQISNALCSWAGNVVSAVTQTNVYTVGTSFIPNMGQLYYLALDSTYPSFTLLIITAFICLLLALFSVQSVKNTLPLGIYVCMGAYLALISVTFFLFCPDQFPYTLTQYSELYMKQQIALWMFIPTVASFSVFLVDLKPSAAVVTFLAITAISFSFGCLRYPVFLVVLHAGSSLFMAPLFFTLGVLFDFLQMISAYIIYIRYTSGYLEDKRHKRVWRW